MLVADFTGLPRRLVCWRGERATAPPHADHAPLPARHRPRLAAALRETAADAIAK